MSKDTRPDETDLLLATPRFRVVRRFYRTSDGREHHREIVEHPGAVTILPLVDEDHVCLIQNDRVAVGERLIELPAGTSEPGEDPLETAHRELEEETGYRAANIEELLKFFKSPGILNETMVLYMATGLTLGQKHLDEGEQIENLVVPWKTALAWIDNGRIKDAKTIVGLLYYDRIRQRPVANS